MYPLESRKDIYWLESFLSLTSSPLPERTDIIGYIKVKTKEGETTVTETFYEQKSLK